MSDSEPGREPAPIPMPRNDEEFELWVQRANNSYKFVSDGDEAMERALAAVRESFQPVLSPQREMLRMLLEGITRYASEKERGIRRRHGRVYSFKVFELIYQINKEAFEYMDEGLLIRLYQENGFEELLSYQPRINKTKSKSAYHIMRPLSRRQLLRKLMREAGAYVSQHKVILLSIPSARNPKKPEERKPLELERRRYPLIRPNETLD